MTPQFTATGRQWDRFFKLATINSHINNIAVEIKPQGLFTSAINKPYSNCWSIVKADFSTKGEGLFVVNTEDIQKVIKLMDLDGEYTAWVESELRIEGEMEQIKCPLLSIQSHQDESNSKSTWINEIETPDGMKRWYRRLYIENNIPICAAPPLVGEKLSSGPFEQIIKVETSDLQKTVKQAKILDEKSIVLELSKSFGTLQISIVNKIGFSHTKELPMESLSEIDWEQKFKDPIQDIFSLAGGDITLAMTEKPNPLERNDKGVVIESSDINPGLWVVIQEEKIMACYLIEHLDESEED